MDKKNSPDHLQ